MELFGLCLSLVIGIMLIGTGLIPIIKEMVKVHSGKTPSAWWLPYVWTFIMAIGIVFIFLVFHHVKTHG